MKKKIMIGILIIVILSLIFGLKDFLNGVKEGFNDGRKTEELMESTTGK
ncbi:hypothetical protein ACFO6R_05875 [Eubacterium multiforme]|uniref:Uncharacterized protein n=1 Tax=Eubacterium multiforme TaxID=83339 RepID=A0ABT9US29_9FIRM|nr:hypothetical protein [Eubacterium multiforme]MDQ0149111.1 hypothetical protein [Eubacterium multiforme]